MSSSYLGQSPVFGDFPFQILSGDGTAVYTLNFKSSGTNGVLVFLNGAVQRPGTDFSVVGDQLTFQENVSIGVQIFVYGMGLPKSSLAPSQGSVGPAELASDVYATALEAQDWTNLVKLLSPKGLSDAFKGTNQSLTTSGYQKLPGGLIIQWGAVSVNSGVSLAFSYPIAFTNSTLIGVCSHNVVAGGNATIHTFSTSGASIYNETTAGPHLIGYVVIGY